MHSIFDSEFQRQMTRRNFFGGLGLKLGGIALAQLGLSRLTTAQAATTGAHPPLPGLPHFKPRAKALIYLHMNGGPSQLDTFDYKPGLTDLFGKDLPPSVQGGQRLSTMTSGQKNFPVAPSKFSFQQHGQCGRWVSSLLPHTARIVDDIAVIKTVHTNAINHDPACTFLFSGSEIPGRPSLGSWVSYGLGSGSENLPSFVVFTPKWPDGSNGQAIYSRLWNSGFLPGKYSGVAFRSEADPVLYLPNPSGVDQGDRRALLDTLGDLNRHRLERHHDPDTQNRIDQYEMAFRLQSSVPELTDLSKESKATLDLYGSDVNRPGSFAQSCLQARRLVERGVRTVQLFHRGWDSHSDLPKQLGNQCKDTDQGCAALVQDLKQRGLLDQTLVVWGGEFGRTVYSQGGLKRDNYGRDHHPRNFCMWMAGGGVKGGVSYGETDDYSYNVVEKPVHLNDLNATILHCLGINHERFGFKFQGLDQRLTGVEPCEIIKGILA
ncbi:MAG: DUF1501 domain-containing protein [Pedosphaera sp.]|nr:DUF1501 domain-containing protein [Pedosphaera sp.]